MEAMFLAISLLVFIVLFSFVGIGWVVALAALCVADIVMLVAHRLFVAADSSRMTQNAQSERACAVAQRAN
jgi:hypothetical protein